MASIDDIARDFTAMLRAGQFEAAGNRYWAADVTSVEPVLPSATRTTVSGIDATRRKCNAHFGAVVIDEIGIDGPFVTGDQFVLFLDLIMVDAASGEHQPFTEIALYTVRDAEITEEKYFYD